MLKCLTVIQIFNSAKIEHHTFYSIVTSEHRMKFLQAELRINWAQFGFWYKLGIVFENWKTTCTFWLIHGSTSAMKREREDRTHFKFIFNEYFFLFLSLLFLFLLFFLAFTFELWVLFFLFELVGIVFNKRTVSAIYHRRFGKSIWSSSSQINVSRSALSAINIISVWLR